MRCDAMRCGCVAPSARATAAARATVRSVSTRTAAIRWRRSSTSARTATVRTNCAATVSASASKATMSSSRSASRTALSAALCSAPSRCSSLSSFTPSCKNYSHATTNENKKSKWVDSTYVFLFPKQFRNFDLFSLDIILCVNDGLTMSERSLEANSAERHTLGTLPILWPSSDLATHQSLSVSSRINSSSPAWNLSFRKSQLFAQLIIVIIIKSRATT
jgi:hypothetical protein